MEAKDITTRNIIKKVRKDAAETESEIEHAHFAQFRKTTSGADAVILKQKAKPTHKVRERVRPIIQDEETTDFSQVYSRATAIAREKNQSHVSISLVKRKMYEEKMMSHNRPHASEVKISSEDTCQAPTQEVRKRMLPNVDEETSDFSQVLAYRRASAIARAETSHASTSMVKRKTYEATITSPKEPHANCVSPMQPPKRSKP